MMNIALHTVLTLDDNEKYVVVAKIAYEQVFYDYLLQITEDGENVTDNVMIVKEEIENNQVFVEEISDENILKIVTPLLQQQLEQQNYE